MAVAEETTLKWAWDHYIREEIQRQRRALEEIAGQRRGRVEDGVIILNDNDKKAPGPSNPVRHDDPGQGKDGGGAQDDDSDNDGDDDGDYTNFYKLLDM
ncbi:putative WRKY transcription factor 35 [Hordeum vulgare]|nr:putative WRKY transcription factor 35 [Hordeum vulgare]